MCPGVVTRAGGYGYVWHWIFLKRRVGVERGRVTELDRTFDVTLLISEYYVKFRPEFTLNHQKGTGK